MAVCIQVSKFSLFYGRYKQRGARAVEANNVFHHLTYGDVDVAAIEDPQERAALEAQVRLMLKTLQLQPCIMSYEASCANPHVDYSMTPRRMDVHVA